VLPDGSGTVVVGNALIRLDARGGITWRRDEVAWASSDATGSVIIDSRGRLTLLDPDGRETWSTPLGVKPSDVLVRAPSGATYIPAESGELVIVRPRGEVRALSIARSALRRVALDVPRHRVIVAAGSGVVAAVTSEE
jgi:hypothetical protein